jgi:hypothetical protein
MSASSLSFLSAANWTFLDGFFFVVIEVYLHGHLRIGDALFHEYMDKFLRAHDGNASEGMQYQ